MQLYNKYLFIFQFKYYAYLVGKLIVVTKQL